MRVTVTDNFIKSLERIGSFREKISDVKCWFKYHTRRDFFRVLWEVLKGYPWSSYYMLRLEKRKLEELANYQERVKRFVGWEYVVRDIRICINLLGIMLEEVELFDYTGDIKFEPCEDNPTCYNLVSDNSYVCKVHVNTKNIDRFETRPEYKKVLLKFPHELYILKARALYHKIRFEHEQEWAD